ncbi:MAG: Uma2 family endonuclease [Vulcanimicrobiaceae bacterium]
MQLRPITVDEYHKMDEAGVFRPDERVELLDGLLIAVPPMGPEHAYSVRRISDLFVRTFSGRANVDVALPVELSQYSEPQPDFMLLRYREDFYAGRTPEPDDVLLVIEVSKATLSLDRGRKLRAYARAGDPGAMDRRSHPRADRPSPRTAGRAFLRDADLRPRGSARPARLPGRRGRRRLGALAAIARAGVALRKRSAAPPRRAHSEMPGESLGMVGEALAAAAALALVVIGVGALFAPGPSSAGYGLRARDPAARAYVQALGARDLALGLLLAVFLIAQTRAALGATVALCALVGALDFLIVFRERGASARRPLALHGFGTLALIVTWLLLRSR